MKKIIILWVLLNIATHIVCAQDADNNGVPDNVEESLIAKFKPCLILPPIASGTTEGPDDHNVAPRPVELMRLWVSVYSLGDPNNCLGFLPFAFIQQLNQLGGITFDPTTISAAIIRGNLSILTSDTKYLGVVYKENPGIGIGSYLFKFYYDWAGPDNGNGYYDTPSGWYDVWENGRTASNGFVYNQAGKSYPNTMYSHVFVHNGETVIQYWFFYPFNNFVNDHEGDWEHINVVVTNQDPNTSRINRVIYYFHKWYYRADRPQSEFSTDYNCYVVDQTHPVVFVGGYWSQDFTWAVNYYRGYGPGSHGSYPVHGLWGNIKRLATQTTTEENIYQPLDMSKYLHWNNFQSIILRNPSYYNYDITPELSWLSSNLLFGYPNVESPGWDIEGTYIPLYGTIPEVGNTPPLSPYYNGWEVVDWDGGGFASYSETPPYNPPSAAGFVWPNDNTPPIVAVTFPSSGIVLDTGKSCEIKWSATDNIGGMNGIKDIWISYSLNGGISWLSIMDAQPTKTNDGVHKWVPIFTDISDNCYIKIVASDAVNNLTTSISQKFIVLGPYLAPSTPSLTGTYVPATTSKGITGTVNLTWSCILGNLPAKYNVELKEPYNSTTAFWVTVAESLTATSFIHYNDPVDSGAGYRVKVFDGRTYTYSNVIVIYPPVDGDPIVSYSTTQEATAYSCGKKLVIDNTGKLHVVFTSNDSVYYTTSTDDGNTWSTLSSIGEGKNPAIELNSTQTPSVCWSKVNKLYYSEHSANVWSVPQLIYTGPTGSEVAYLSYVLDQKTNNSYLGWVDDGATASAVYISPYIAKGSALLTSLPIEQGGAGSFKSPSLTLDRNGNFKAAWSNNGRVYYFDETGQVALGENGIHPIVEIYGDRTSVVWQEEVAPSIYQIVKKNKGPLGWGEKHVISYPDEKNADFPVVAANGQYVYSKNTTGNDYDIFWHGEYDNGWTQYERNITYASGGISKYPFVAFRQFGPESKLYILWTEDLPVTKIVRPKPVKIYIQIVDPVSYYYADLGTEEATVYTIQKAGTITYGQTPDLTVDYHPTQLKYSFAGLDPARYYMLKAVYYHESKDQIQQKITVNGQQFDVFNLTPKEKTEYKRWLMPILYTNGQVEIIIDKQQGEYAVCSVLSIEEYEKDCDNTQNGGTQSDMSEAKSVAYHYELMQNVPNPCSKNTMINYQLAKQGQVSLKVYNTLGQVVKTLVNESQNPGSYSVKWNGNDEMGKQTSAGIYFYRMASGDFNATKKMVVIW